MLYQENEAVYMDNSFVHQQYWSGHPYFQKDKQGAVHDGFGRTSGKGDRMTMVYATNKCGPLVSRDIDGFPTPKDSS